MSKIQLKNVSNMNQGIPAGPLDGKLNMREAGALNESGMLDDSGLIDESGFWEQVDGYDYVTVNVESISLRYLVMWSGGNYVGSDIVNPFIILDDIIFNPYATGNLGEPITNSDPDHYEFVCQQVNEYSVTDHHIIDGSATVEYLKYPKGKSHINEDGGQPITRYACPNITYAVPVPEDE